MGGDVHLFGYKQHPIPLQKRPNRLTRETDDTLSRQLRIHLKS
jgi:hypothetical protein